MQRYRLYLGRELIHVSKNEKDIIVKIGEIIDRVGYENCIVTLETDDSNIPYKLITNEYDYIQYADEYIRNYQDELNQIQGYKVLEKKRGKKR